MALLPILEYPDPRLRIHAEPVTEVDAEVRALVDDMLETMYAAPGVGLAATQVNIHKRVLVVDVSEDQRAPVCLINPEIVTATGKKPNEEGCLSVPDVFETVERAEAITVSALDRDGNRIELEAQGMLAVCIQHEIDHLDGKLFVDYLSPLKRDRLRKRFTKKAKREAGEKRPAASAVVY